MRSINYFLLFCLLGPGCAAPAQTVPGIRHSYAFLTEHQPGNIIANPDGTPVHNGPDTLLTVYLEMAATASPIVWKNAWLKGVAYTVQSMPAAKTPLEVGAQKTSREMIVLTPAKGYSLQRLELSRADSKQAAPASSKPGEIILEGKRAGKKMILRISSVVELASIPSV